MLRNNRQDVPPSTVVGGRNAPATRKSGDMPSRAASFGRVLVEIAVVLALVYSANLSSQCASKLLASRDANVALLQNLEETQAELTSSRSTKNAAGNDDRDARAHQDLTQAKDMIAQLKSQATEFEAKIHRLESAAEGRNKAFDRIRKYLADTMMDLCEREYTEGPAHVKIETSEGDLEIEMAPCNLMPVVTMHFLRQVKDGFWDGMSFFRAESHVIQATDMHVDKSRSSRPSHMIKRSKSIPFQEYSEGYVHKKYTLGIAGRPGGPDFYVNMLDNIKIHGPGGQGHNYQGDPESDSCFAKLVYGQEVMNKIQKMPYNKEGGLHILQQPVEIRRMTIVAPSSRVIIN